MDLSPASLIQNIALFKTQALGSLFGASDNTANDIFSSLLNQKIAGQGNASDASAMLASTSNSTGLSANGRNVSLFDPESAYKMMSLINNRDVFKAQYSELGSMSAAVAQMQTAGQSLGNISANTSSDDIANGLQHFVDQYNNWRSTFNADVESGGLLNGTQAAEVSLYELEQSAKNTFFGAKDGVHGLGDLGISINANTHMASFDPTKLQATLASNPQGAVNAIQDFSTNFAKSAELLNSTDNFLPNQLANLNRAIHYIDDNKTALTKEFGSGDAAHPTGKVAQALAAYKQTYGDYTSYA